MSIERILERVLESVALSESMPKTDGVSLAARLAMEVAGLAEKDRNLLLQHLGAMCAARDPVAPLDDSIRPH